MKNIFFNGYKKVNTILDSTTMYRVALYALAAIAGYAVLLSFLGVLSYNGFFLLLSLALLVSVCYLVNQMCSFFTKIPAHVESSVITAGILFFLLSPIGTLSDALFLALGGTIAMASKYVFAFRGRQIFNPAAFAALALGFFGSGAMWWVGSSALFPAVAIAALCIVKKMRRQRLFFITVVASFIPIIALNIRSSQNIMDILLQHLLSWPVIFFASVMVTEPLTTPPKKRLQMIYGAAVGALSSMPFHIGPLYSTPELALIIGNIFSYAVSMRQRLFLRLREKKYIAKDVCEFAFESDHAMAFSPGQYLEWTLPHNRPDMRGIRRYFTIASSPTEKTLNIGIRFNTPSSSFKKTLRSLEPGNSIRATQLCGDFTLPKDTEKKLVFIAGGIGITPFRSMIQHLIDTKDKREIVLFYQNKTSEDIAYKELFDKAAATLHLQTVYLVSTTASSIGWSGETGYLTTEMLQKYVHDIHKRLWYLSGPSSMVDTYKKLLLTMNIKKKNIITDYFPGFA